MFPVMSKLILLFGVFKSSPKDHLTDVHILYTQAKNMCWHVETTTRLLTTLLIEINHSKFSPSEIYTFFCKREV